MVCEHHSSFAPSGDLRTQHHRSLPCTPVAALQVYEIEATDGNFEMAAIFGAGILSVTFFGVLLLLRRFEHPHWPRIEAKLLKIDRFKDDHYTATDEEESGPEIAGAMASVTYLVAVGAMCVLTAYNFANFNFDVSQALVPKDEAKVKTIVSSFEINVEFVGYTGCTNASVDVDENGVFDGQNDIKTPNIIDTGLIYDPENRIAQCQCAQESGTVESLIHGEQPFWVNKGSYLCQWMVQDALVDASPRIQFISKPTCGSCLVAHDENGTVITNDYGGTAGTTNKVYDCPNCSLATAQAIRWDAWASPIWASPASPNIVPWVDINRVNGTLGTGDPAAVFRGAEPNEVTLSMIPAAYADTLAGGKPADKQELGFRLQFAESAVGSIATFETRAPVFNGSELRPRDFQDEDLPMYSIYYDGSLRENFIASEGASTDFVGVTMENMVAFEMNFAQADVMLAASITPDASFMTVLGVLGGLFPIIAGLVVLVMNNWEMVNNPLSPFRQKVRAQADRARAAVTHVRRASTNASFDMSSEEGIRSAFKMFDTDGNGFITKSEFRQIMGKLGDQLSKKDTEALIHQADTNGDGQIDYDEFVRMMMERAHCVHESALEIESGGESKALEGGTSPMQTDKSTSESSAAWRSQMMKLSSGARSEANSKLAPTVRMLEERVRALETVSGVRPQTQISVGDGGDSAIFFACPTGVDPDASS